MTCRSTAIDLTDDEIVVVRQALDAYRGGRLAYLRSIPSVEWDTHPDLVRWDDEQRTAAGVLGRLP